MTSSAKDSSAVDPVEEGRQAVESLTKKLCYLMANIPPELTEVYKILHLDQNDVIIVGYPKSDFQESIELSRTRDLLLLTFSSFCQYDSFGAKSEKIRSLCGTGSNDETKYCKYIEIVNKCIFLGTNWMEQICHQIKMRGKDEDFEELTNEVPLIDIFGPLGGADLQKPQKGDFKIFKSHYTFDQLHDCMKTAKFVIILREPHDTFASFYQWAPRFEWDLAPYADNITVENFYNGKIVHPEAEYPKHFYKFLLSWLANYKKLNSIIVYYQDLIKDLPSELDRISSFLGVSLTDEEKQQVKYLSSFDYMKANNHKFDLHTFREKLQESIEKSTGEKIGETENPTFISKGGNRKGKEELSASVKTDMEKQWKEIIESKLGYKSFDEAIQAVKDSN